MLRDDTGAICMAQILKGLVNRVTDIEFFFFLASHFNQGVRHFGQDFGLRKIILVLCEQWLGSDKTGAGELFECYYSIRSEW